MVALQFLSLLPVSARDELVLLQPEPSWQRGDGPAIEAVFWRALFSEGVRKQMNLFCLHRDWYLLHQFCQNLVFSL